MTPFIVTGILLLAAAVFLFVRQRTGRGIQDATGDLRGREGVVTERIVNEDQTGRVRIGGMDWKAHHAGSMRTLEKGTVVRVADIDGNRLLVEPTGEVHGTDEEEEDYISIDIL